MLILLLTTGFIIQLKILYHNYQRNIRLVEYRERINELSDNMKSMNRIANTTSELMKKLLASLSSKRLNQQITIS
ncbi:hypothetical protein HUJ05_009862 [Dendroctonus ponderosae]|nr:hypothetical protein HUJ05_009862 [Dendroctonus ponderosae]